MGTPQSYKGLGRRVILYGYIPAVEPPRMSFVLANEGQRGFARPSAECRGRTKYVQKLAIGFGGSGVAVYICADVSYGAAGYIAGRSSDVVYVCLIELANDFVGYHSLFADVLGVPTALSVGRRRHSA